jgi:hypothetical protein
MDFFLRNFQILVGLWMIVDCVKAQILLNKSFGPFVYQGRPIWQYRLWSFQTRGTKLERFLPKKEVQIVYRLFLVKCYLLHVPRLLSQPASNVGG